MSDQTGRIFLLWTVFEVTVMAFDIFELRRTYVKLVWMSQSKLLIDRKFNELLSIYKCSNCVRGTIDDS